VDEAHVAATLVQKRWRGRKAREAVVEQQQQASASKVLAKLMTLKALSAFDDMIPASRAPEVTKDEAAFKEGFVRVGNWGESAKLYLERENRVLLDANADWQANECVGGALSPTRFWYETFMPKLLAACSTNAEDTVFLPNGATEDQLDSWFLAEVASRRLSKYGSDVVSAWPQLKGSPEIKRRLVQAWRLTRHYFLGPQKQRERFGEDVDHRETGTPPGSNRRLGLHMIAVRPSPPGLSSASLLAGLLATWSLSRLSSRALVAAPSTPL